MVCVCYSFCNSKMHPYLQNKTYGTLYKTLIISWLTFLQQGMVTIHLSCTENRKGVLKKIVLSSHREVREVKCVASQPLTKGSRNEAQTELRGESRDSRAAYKGKSRENESLCTWLPSWDSESVPVIRPPSVPRTIGSDKAQDQSSGPSEHSK